MIDASKEAETQAVRVTIKARAERDAADMQADATVRLANAAKAEGPRRSRSPARADRGDQPPVAGAEHAQVPARAADRAAGGDPAVRRADEVDRRHQDRAGRRPQSRRRHQRRGRRADDASGRARNLAESVVAAALAYRAHAPLIDSLLAEVGLNSTSLAGLTKGIADGGHPRPRDRRQGRAGHAAAEAELGGNLPVSEFGHDLTAVEVEAVA